ncbi:putative sulfate exporter family transporter [Bacillus horti]
MILAIGLGVLWRHIFGQPTHTKEGVTFSSKMLLRAGIILMGFRINFNQIIEAGFSVILIDITVIVFTIVLVILIGRWLSLDRFYTALIAVGTAICGAAAIVAVAPLIGAKKAHTVLSIACISILGTIGTVVLTFVYPILNVDPYLYGFFVGATFQELAHVLAASAQGGSTSEEIAILVKLGRVVLLIPAAIVLAYLFKPSDAQEKNRVKLKKLPVPWFIVGFLASCMINTLVQLPQGFIHFSVSSSVFLLAMAMAGLGLSISFQDVKQAGYKPILVGGMGFLALVLLVPLLLLIF